MTTMVVLVVKVTLVLAAGLGLARLWRRQAAALRHAVLVATVVAALALPLVALVAPAWGPVVAPVTAPVDDPRIDVATAAVAVAPPAPAASTAARPNLPMVTMPRVFGAIWLLVAASALGRLARDAWRLRALARTSTAVHDARWLAALAALRTRIGIDADVQLRIGPPAVPVVTWGLRQPRVLLPADALAWPDQRIEHVLAHELAHVARGDWAFHLLLAAADAIYAWHPLMRVVVQAARREAERACDDAVLATGASASAYASTLIDVARASRARSAAATLAMADPSSLERRIAAMLDVTLDHTHATRGARALGAGLVLAFTLAVAGLSAQAQGTGVVSGTVLPTGGTPIANVTITFTGASTTTVTTDADGRFTATLPGGTWRAEIRTPGFKRFSARVDVAPGATVARDFALALGEVQESISVTAGGAPRPVSERTREASGPPPTRPAGTLAPPLKLRDVKPQYDEALKAAGITGKVVVAARIGADGYVTDTRVVSSPDERLSAAALDAIEQWRFAPTLLQGKPVATDMNVTIDFSIKQ